MTTPQIELRTESRRKAVMLNRIAQPHRDAGAAWIVMACVLGAMVAVVLGIVLGV